MICGRPSFAKAVCRRHKKLGVDVEPNWGLILGVIVKRKFLVLRTRLASTATAASWFPLGRWFAAVVMASPDCGSFRTELLPVLVT